MVIDSHALYWWLEGSKRLPAQVRQRIGYALEADGLMVPAVTVWEMRLKERRGLIEPSTPVEGWEGLLDGRPGFRWVPTSAAIWFRSADLPWDHKDLADRIIAATALVHGVPVLTKDERFHRESSPVEAVW